MIALKINYFPPMEAPPPVMSKGEETAVFDEDGKVIGFIPLSRKDNPTHLRMSDQVLVNRKGNIWYGRMGVIVGFKPNTNSSVVVNIRNGSQVVKIPFMHDELLRISEGTD